MAERSLNLLLCDARQGEPNLRPYQLILAADELPTVGLALIRSEERREGKECRL